MRRPALAFLMAAWSAGSFARAHDVPDERVDRTIQATIEPGRLLIDYEIALSRFTILLDLRRLETDESDGADVWERYGELVAPLHAAGLMADVDGDPIECVLLSVQHRAEDHLVYRFTYEAELPPAGHLTFRDTNHLTSEGTSRIGLRVHPKVEVKNAPAESEVLVLPAQPVWRLSAAEERATREFSLDFESRRAADPFKARRLVAPISDVGRGTNGGRSLDDLLERRGWAAVAIALGFAFVFGVAHAVQPGHGKLLIASASVAGGRGVGRSLVLAMVVAVSHLASVSLLAVFLWLSEGRRVDALDDALKAIAGAMLAILGAHRIGRSLAGRRSAPQANRRGDGGWLAAVGAGILPCWDAVLLLLLARAHERLLLGLWLVAAFSLGLMFVQFAIAVGASRVGGRVGDGWGPVLSFGSGLALLGLGLMLVVK